MNDNQQIIKQPIPTTVFCKVKAMWIFNKKTIEKYSKFLFDPNNQIKKMT